MNVLDINFRITSIVVFLCLAISICFLTGCANVTKTLTGGPKDETPPLPLKSKPANYSIQYNGTGFEVYFDEYVQLKDASKKLVISPPMEKKPQIILKGKSIEVVFKEELYDSTTYTFNFGDAIVDNNEGNAIPKFEFVFSTGDYIDSLSFSGRVVDAFTNEPAEGVFAMLYDNLKDSVPLQEVPLYVSKTDTSGIFTINNMKLDTFKLFVLDDKNFNYIYDSQQELVAFSDSFVNFYYSTITHVDSLPDTVIVETINGYFADNVLLYLYQEEDFLQYLTDNERPEKHKLEFKFNRPLFDSVTISPIYIEPNMDWLVEEKAIDFKSVIFWIADSSIYNLDTIRLSVNYSVLDSSNQLTLKSDTVFMRFQDIDKKDRRKDREVVTDSVPEINYLNIATTPKNNSTIDLNKSIVLEPETPISNIDTAKIHFYEIVDSIEVEKNFMLSKDTFFLRKYYIQYKWEENKPYKLYLEPGAFTDIYGIDNDTLVLATKARGLDYYGNLFLNMENVSSPLLVQLLGAKGEVVLEKACTKNGQLGFKYLKPGDYSFKLIYDTNSNKKWDTGNYFEQTQPENVLFNPKKINVRANWDIEETWNIPE